MYIANTRKYVIGLGIALFVGILIIYALFEARFLILGPVISIEKPVSGTTTTDPLVEIRGRAENITHITLNDRPIFIDEEGYFTERLLLGPGYTIMEVRVEDRFGRSREEYIHLVLN